MKKRILSLLLAVLLLVGLLPTSALAASSLEDAMREVSIYARNDDLNWLTMNGSVRTQHYTYYRYTSVLDGSTTEVPAYCVDPNLYGVPALVPEGTAIHYTCSETVSDPKVCGIVSNGYPHVDLRTLGVNSVEEAYYATKTALWCYILRGSWSINKLGINPALTGADKEAAQRVLKATQDIYYRGMLWNVMISPKLTAQPDRASAYPVTINGERYYQQIFTVTTETWPVGQKAAVTLAGSVPAGARIVDLQDREAATVALTTAGEIGFQGKIKILYPVASVEGKTGSVQLNLSATVVQYAIFYAVCAEKDRYGNVQNYMLDTDPNIPIVGSAISNFSAAASPEVSNEQTALRIVKVEEGTNAPLEGAIFKVTNPNGTVLGSFSSGPDGTVTIPVDIVGHYTVEEITPPKWHTLSAQPTQHVTVLHGKTAVVTYENAPCGNLRVEKSSDTGEALPGVTVQVKDIASGTTYTKKTGAGGAAIFNELRPAAYEVREIAGIEGWQFDGETVKTVSVTAGETVSVSFINKELPGLRITKYDRTTHTVLEGVTFEVWHDGVSIGRYVTDMQGEILLPNAATGTYLVKEVQGPNTHIVCTTPQQIELKVGDGIRTLVFFNDLKPGLTLTKVDSADLSKPIANAKFELKKVDGSYGPVELLTNERGEIDLSKLPTGAYVVTEKACAGYVIDDAQRIIELKPNENAEFVFTNSVLPSLYLKKLSADGTPLAGVSFRLSKIEDGAHYLDRTTNAAGEILWEGLTPGVWSLKEISTVSDHILDLREYHVALFAGKTSTKVLQNQRRPNLTVYKHDADTGEPIANTVFEVRAADGHSVDQIKTDGEGKAELRNLLPGVYEIIEKSVPAPYLLDAPSQLATLYPDRDHTVYFENHQKPALTVKKVDSVTGDPLQGAKFHVTYASNNTGSGEINDLGTYYTDEHGQFQLTGLRDGWYKVTEQEPPTGYAIKEATQEVYIQSGTGKVLTFENIPLSALVVWKYDSVTGVAVSNAVFQVKYLTGTSGTGGTVIGTYKTSANGSFTVTGLKEGTYIVEELASDSGHVIDSAPQTAYISGKQQDVVQLYFGNSPKGSLLVKKIDSVTHKPLSDVEFFVTTADGTVVGDANGKYVTDSAGSFTVSGIAPGTTLVVKETRARDGYLLDDAPQTATVKAGQTVTLEFRNQPQGGVLVKKVDAVTNAPISDVEFLVTDSDGNLIGNANGKFVTDSAGTFTIPAIAPDTTLIIKEVRAKAGYILDDTPQTVKVKSNEVITVEFRNQPQGSLIINKLSSANHAPLEGVRFKIVFADGSYVDDGALSSKGIYYSDKNGQIILNVTGTVVVTEEASIEGYTIDPNTRTQTVEVRANDTQTLTFFNDPIGGLELIKVNAAKPSERIPNTTFEIRRAGDDTLADTVTTGTDGRVYVPLASGSYYAVETDCPSRFKLDSTPHYFTVEDGKTSKLTVTNQPLSGILIHKIDSTTGKGISGVSFLLYDSSHRPIGEYTSDQRGYVYIDDLTAGGRYYLRELENEGYVADTELKTVYVRSGEVTELTWKNTPICGQIQIVKKSADYNPTNGLPAGSLLEGAVFEVYDKAGNVVDTIRTDRNGRATSKLLPLSRYTIREVRAPAFYSANPTAIVAYLEHEGQIVTFEVTNASANTSVAISKTGPKEIVAGQMLRYVFSGIANTGNTTLTSFYWRDSIPAQVTLNKVVTGTYNAAGSYKIVYKVNGTGDYRTLADNLSAAINYTLDTRAVTLGLAADEKITEIMFVFGQAPAGFAQVETPMLYCTAASNLAGGSAFVNVADAGGIYSGQWVQAVARWTTAVYGSTPMLPKTGH